MNSEVLVKLWFKCWEEGDFRNLPVTDDFKHTSPFGTINGKSDYVALVEANKEKFLGYTFDIEDALYENDKACVRYIGIQGDFRLEVSEWYYLSGGLIQEIVTYYHIGEIREERQLNS